MDVGMVNKKMSGERKIKILYKDKWEMYRLDVFQRKKKMEVGSKRKGVNRTNWGSKGCCVRRVE